jgi:RimJ/RimL family protein N-acetyltransferase
MGEWKDDVFHEAGFAFTVVSCGHVDLELSAFAGYAFFKPYWGTLELPVLAMLGLTYLFNEFKLHALHGTRFEDNLLTARFMAQFGFKEDGLIPKYQLKDGKLVPAVVSTLMREDFEAYVESWLIEQFRPDEVPAEPEPAPGEEKKDEPPQLSLAWL